MVSVPNSPLTLPLRGKGMWETLGERVWVRGYFNLAMGEAQAFAPAFGGGIHCGTCSLP